MRSWNAVINTAVAVWWARRGPLDQFRGALASATRVTRYSPILDGDPFDDLGTLLHLVLRGARCTFLVVRRARGGPSELG